MIAVKFYTHDAVNAMGESVMPHAPEIGSMIQLFGKSSDLVGSEVKSKLFHVTQVIFIVPDRTRGLEEDMCAMAKVLLKPATDTQTVEETPS